FAAPGYVVACVNYHGSSSFGFEFLDSITGHWGEFELQDIEAGTDWLLKKPWVASKRIVATGGSYGGYMVLSALAFRPEAFKVGIDIFGVSNWIRTLESIPPYWESF
ncbi:prolyl oligopeptidase family serine peptidase, partial [Klebsiella pneumoniae]|uniref:prolyl oligopeptidase family serine peptidase n=1 Tax=Klebsiella pneumoniae TaxID=573 RepID=UPI002731E1C5